MFSKLYLDFLENKILKIICELRKKNVKNVKFLIVENGLI